MKFSVKIDVMPKKALLDPQGKTVEQSLHQIGFDNLNEVRIGKHITLNLEASSETEAKEKVEKACKTVLANLVMEQYKYEITAE